MTPGSKSKATRKTNVTATFSEDMDADSLQASGTFTLLKKGKSTPVRASVSYDPDTGTLTLDPTKDLTRGTYTARITTAAKDAAGNALVQDEVWSFTVRK